MKVKDIMTAQPTTCAPSTNLAAAAALMLDADCGILPVIRMTTAGVLVVVSRVHRSQAKNREAARGRLVALLKRAAKSPTKRTPTKPRAAAREKRLLSKKRLSAVKRTRREQDED